MYDVRIACKPRWKEKQLFWRNLRPLIIVPTTAICTMPFLLSMANGTFSEFQVYLKLSSLVGGFFSFMIGAFLFGIYWSQICDRRQRLKFLKRSRRIREYIHIMNLEEVNWMVNEL